jgi:hypothetical protein
MEKELLAHFAKKKERNLAKNKPERFKYLDEAIPKVMDFKRKLMEDGHLEDKDVYNKMEESKEGRIKKIPKMQI